MRVDQGWCRPAAEAPDAVVGRGLLGGLEKGEAYSVRLLAARPELRWWCCWWSCDLLLAACIRPFTGLP
jgi:hypothetical protein